METHKTELSPAGTSEQQADTVAQEIADLIARQRADQRFIDVFGTPGDQPCPEESSA